MPSIALTPAEVNIPPNQSVSSIRRVLAPFRADCIAAEVPPAPPPTITTSNSDESSHENKRIVKNKIILFNHFTENVSSS